jgi:hypothetical protein
MSCIQVGPEYDIPLKTQEACAPVASSCGVGGALLRDDGDRKSVV